MDDAAPAPGIMPSQALARAVREGWIRSAASPVPEANVQPASLDLRLGEVAYRHALQLPARRRATVEEQARRT